MSSTGEDIVVLGAARTPIGAFQGTLAAVPAPELAAVAIAAALQRCSVATEAVSDVVMGEVLTAGTGQAPARQAAIKAGLPPSVRSTTLNKVCGSGMEAIFSGRRTLLLGESAVVVAGGMESMSRAPYLLPKAREGYRLGHQQVVDSLVADGLWDPGLDRHMGSCAEECAARYNFSREVQDAYAIRSFERANAAQTAGHFAAEIAPVDVPAGRGKSVRIDSDEGPKRVDYQRIPALRPAFKGDGTITAANASTLNDGAAAVVLARADRAQAAGWRPLARIVGTGSHAHEPLWFTTAPVEATRRALAAAGWSVDDVDLWEVNEAFAVVPLAFMQELGIDSDRVNVDGGAIALGHPIGASGARLVVTLLHALQRRGLRRGVATLCIGGGEGIALCLERCGNL